ncbi:MAG: helix-turn-helix transcriptional regulator [Actinomycetota bacterium]|nr:helix-turn-helix transcriptional regulator [Actinomycetota bacterium]
MEVDPQDPLGAARAALRRRDYAAAYRTLHEARAKAGLQPDDLALLADAAWWLGRISECLTITEELHRRYLVDGKVERAALQALDLGGVWMMRGEYTLASGWLGRARRLLEGQPRGRGHGLLSYIDACGAVEEGRFDEARSAARDLRQLGADLDDDTFTALGLLVGGLAEIRCGRLREGFSLMDEAMLPVMADRVAPEWAGNIYCTIMATCYDLMDLPRAREWTRATEKWLTGFSDAVMFLGVCRAHRLQLHAVEGAWAEVEQEAAVVERDLLDLNLGALAETAYQLGETFRQRGLHDRAAASYALAAERGRDPQPGAALLQLGSGDLEGAWSAITAAVTGSAPDTFACARLLRAQVEIGLAAGHVGAAGAAAAHLEDIRDRFRTPGFAAWADQARGAVLLAEGRASEAVAPLSLAAGSLRQMGAVYDAATAELVLASAHRAAGDSDAAQAHEVAARAAFERLGVPTPRVAVVGSRPLPGGLTEREAEVLARVVTGASNRDVAASLSISEATVRRHLANIFAKLGVSSRTAAAAWAHEHGL